MALVSTTKTDTGYTIVLGDLGADPRSANAELKRLGINFAINMTPASPSLIGKVVSSGGTSDEALKSVKVTYRNGSTLAGDEATITVAKLPQGQSASISIGRRASDGEVFASTTNSAEEPGEILHCHFVTNQPVAEASAMLAKLGIQARWRNQGQTATTDAPTGQWVWQVMPYSPGVVEITTMPSEPSSSNVEQTAALRAGC